MKKRIVCFLLLCMLLPFAAKGAGADEPGGTVLCAQAERQLTFLCPSAFEIPAGTEKCSPGEICLQELLLESDETLRIVFDPAGVLTGEKQGAALPFSVSAPALPAEISAPDGWTVSLEISRSAWENATAGDYQGSIRYTVFSVQSGEKLAEGTTLLTTSVPDKAHPEPPFTGGTGAACLPLAGLGGVLAAVLFFARKRRTK